MKNSILPLNRKNSWVSLDLRTFRVLCITGMLLLLIFKELHILINPAGTDNLVMRIILSFLCLFFFVSSFKSKNIKKYYKQIAYCMYIFISLWIIHLLYINHFAVDYIFGLLIIIFTASVAMSEKKILFLYLLIVNIIALIFILLETSPFVNRFVFLFLLFIASFLTYFILATRSNFVQEISAREDLMKIIFDSSADALLIIEPSGKIILNCNEHSARLFGASSKNNLIGMKLEHFLKSSSIKEIVKNLHTKNKKNLEIKFIDQNKKEFWGDAAVSEINVHDENLLLVRITDISLRKIAEKALAKSEQRLREITNSIDQYIYSFEVKKDSTLVNALNTPSITSFTGFSLKAHHKNPDLWIQQIHKDDREWVLERFEKVYKKGINDAYSYRIFHKDGRMFWVLDEVYSKRKKAGIGIQVHGVITNVTEQKNAETALRSSEEKNRKIIKTMYDGLIQVDNDNVIQFVNDRMCQMIGYKEEELIDNNIIDVIIQEKDIEFIKEKTAERREGISGQYELEIRSKYGKKIWVQISASPLVDEDNYVIGSLGVFTDISKQKKAEVEINKAKEAAESANQAKSDFLATMSHEIRTPMNGVLGIASLLARTSLDEEQMELVETIRMSGEALLNILNDILDFSKIESGKMDLESKPFELKVCIEEALDLMAAKAAEKKVELYYIVDESVPSFIRGDITRLRQILVNLINNSIKFTKQGEIVVSLNVKKSAKKNKILEFSVKDTGIGIPSEKIERLFKPFSQVDSSTTRKFGGTGLGLVICERLVKLMGGDIRVESETGKGSIFYFTIKTTEEKTAPKRYEEKSIPELKGRNVMIVDDNRTNLKILSLQFQKWGLNPILFENPFSALESIKKGDKYDLAVLDMQMPEMNGLSLSKGIRKYFSQKSLPIIMLTSLGKLPEFEKNAKKYLNIYLTKPIKQSQLFDSVINLLARKTSETQEKTSEKLYQVPISNMAQRFPLNILLAEDNLINQKLALKMLNQMGYQADIACNGLEVLELLDAQRYDLIFMDVQMPELDGLDATRAIVGKWPLQQRPKIIAMTANAMLGDREKCINAGMDDYISKPVRFEDLQIAIEKCYENLVL